METLFERCRSISGVIAIISAGVILCCGLLLMESPNYVNKVWGTVEESIPLGTQDSTRSITVMYTVDDGEYTGTYRANFHSTYYCTTGEAILLSANKDYSRVTPYTEKIELLMKHRDTFVTTAYVAIIVGLVGAGSFFLFGFLNNDFCFEYETDALKSNIRDVRRIARKCKNKPYRKMLYSVSRTMQLRVKELHHEEKLVSGDAGNLVKEKRDSMKKTFGEICTMASTTAIQMTRNSSDDELQKSVYQLQAYLELK